MRLQGCSYQVRCISAIIYETHFEKNIDNQPYCRGLSSFIHYENEVKLCHSSIHLKIPNLLTAQDVHFILLSNLLATMLYQQFKWLRGQIVNGIQETFTTL